MVAYLGRVVEFAASEELYGKPEASLHLRLCSGSIPMGDPRSKGSASPSRAMYLIPPIHLAGAFSSPCPSGGPHRKEEEPKLVELAKDHFVSCHFADKISPHGL